MQAVTTIGLDIAKAIFQVHGVGTDGNVVMRRKLKRRYVIAFFQKLPRCLVRIRSAMNSRRFIRSPRRRASREGGTVRPRTLVACKLIASERIWSGALSDGKEACSKRRECSFHPRSSQAVSRSITRMIPTPLPEF
jgi:hypothetical protein